MCPRCKSTQWLTKSEDLDEADLRENRCLTPLAVVAIP